MYSDTTVRRNFHTFLLVAYNIRVLFAISTLKQEITFMFKRHSRAGGHPVFERLSGYPIKSGMTHYAFHRTAVTCAV